MYADQIVSMILMRCASGLPCWWHLVHPFIVARGELADPKRTIAVGEIGFGPCAPKHLWNCASQRPERWLNRACPLLSFPLVEKSSESVGRCLLKGWQRRAKSRADAMSAPKQFSSWTQVRPQLKVHPRSLHRTMNVGGSSRRAERKCSLMEVGQSIHAFADCSEIVEIKFAQGTSATV